MNIGIIGTGHVGRGVAELAVKAGHAVMISNSRHPKTLFTTLGLIQFKAAHGGRVSAGTAREAAAFGDIVLIAVPLYAIKDIPAEPLAGKIVLDANNYYPERDGVIEELEVGRSTPGEMLARHLVAAKVIKAFSAIPAFDLDKGSAAGTPHRRAQPIAGDDAAAKTIVTRLLDQFGFDAVDAGPLSEGRRFQRDTPAYCAPLDAAGLKTALAQA